MPELLTINDKIDAMFKIREAVRKKEGEIKELNAEREAIEVELLKQMDAEGMTRAAGAKASVTVTESVKPSVEDWDSFYKYIHRMKYYHLLERRPSVTGCRELFEKRGRIPGVVPFLQRQIQMRTNK
jgi:hypothetical protein